MMTLTLPLPPSANRYWRNYRGRMVVSDEAKTYKLAAGWTAKAQGAELLDGEVSMVMKFYRARKSGDLDNKIKVTLDALQGVIYADDSQVVELHAYRYDDKDNPRVEIVVTKC